MKIAIPILLFSLCTSIMSVGMTNNIRITSSAYEDFKLNTLSNDNIEIAISNIATEIPNGEYQLENIARLTLSNNELLCLESIEIDTPNNTFTEHNANIKLKNFPNLNIVSNTLYPNVTFKKFIDTKPKVEFNYNYNRIYKNIGKCEFEIFDKYYDNLLIFR